MAFAGSRARARACAGAGVRAAALLLLLAAPFGLACEESSEGRVATARRLRETGDAAQAIGILREVVERDPDDAEAAYELGLALAGAEQTNVAIVYLRRAESSPEFAAPAAFALANILVTSGNREEAIRALDRVIELEPDNTEALSLRAAASVETGAYERALADAERVLAEDPGRAEALRAKGKALSRTGRAAEAERVFAAMQERAEASGDPAIAAEGCASRAAFLAEERKDEKGAERELDRCAARYPGEPSLVGVALSFYDEHGEPDKALALARVAVEKRPRSLPARRDLADRLAAKGDAAAGEAVLREGVELDGTPPGWATLANYQRKQGERETALASLDRALALSPKALDPLLLAAVDLNAELGRVEAAEALAARMELPVYRDFAAGRIALAKDDPRAALDALSRGLRSWPNNGGARFLAGKAALAIGDEERALSEFVEATRADEVDTDAALARRGDLPAARRLGPRDPDGGAAQRAPEDGAARRAPRLRSRGAGERAARRGADDRGDRRPGVPEGSARARLPGGPDARAGGAEAGGERARGERPRLHGPRKRARDPRTGRAARRVGRAAEGARARRCRAREASGLRLLPRAPRPLARALGQARAGARRARARSGARPEERRSDRRARQRLRAERRRRARPRAPRRGGEARPEGARPRLPGRAPRSEGGTHGRRHRALPRDPRARPVARGDLQRARVAPRVAQGGHAARRGARDPRRPPRARPRRPRHARLRAAAERRLRRCDRRARGLAGAAPKAPGSRYRLGVALAAAGRKGEAERALREALADGAFREADDARARLAELERGASAP